MSIKKSQAILKCFIDLKYSVWFTLGSEGHKKPSKPFKKKKKTIENILLKFTRTIKLNLLLK